MSDASNALHTAEVVHWFALAVMAVVYTLRMVGKKQHKTRVGVGVPGTDEVRADNGRVIGRFMNPGLFGEVVGYLYNQIAEVWQLDNEFAARWASWAFANEAEHFVGCVREGTEPVSSGRDSLQDLQVLEDMVRLAMDEGS